MTAPTPTEPWPAPAPGGRGRSARLRAGDQDRHEAILALTDHFAEGRLDQDEFDRRSSAALTAVYLDELDPLFDDLPPTRRAGSPVAPGPRSGPRPGSPPVFLRLAAALVFVSLVVMTRGGVLLVLAVAFWFLHVRRRAWRRGWDRPPWAGGYPPPSQRHSPGYRQRRW